MCVTDRKRQTKEGEGYSDVIIDEPFFEGGMRIVFKKTTSSAPLLRAVSFIFRPSILASHLQTKTHVFSSFKRILVANKGDSSVKNSSPCQHTHFYFIFFVDFLIFFCTLENVVLQRLKRAEWRAVVSHATTCLLLIAYHKRDVRTQLDMALEFLHSSSR